MTDITKCGGRIGINADGTKNPDGCPVRETCYRLTAPADRLRQSWAYFEHDARREAPCEHYWPVAKEAP